LKEEIQIFDVARKSRPNLQKRPAQETSKLKKVKNREISMAEA
jgi:hypothetical protein